MTGRDPGAPPPERDRVRPFPGAFPGTLATGAGPELPVRAYERADEVVMLVLPLDVPDEVVGEAQPGELRYTSVRGLVRLRGRARYEERDLVRFVPEQPPEVEQRRDHVRVPAVQRVTLTDRRHGQTRRGHALDLSGGGMLLSGVPDVPEGALVRFELELRAGEAPVTGTARVVRTAGDARALAFDHITGAERERLITFVFDCLRQARARVRGR